MKWGQSISSARAVVALSGLLVGTAACTDANESLIILQAQAEDEMCVIKDSLEAGLRRPYGILDVALDKPYAYELFPLIKNQLPPVAAAGEIEPNRVSVTSASVKIVPPPGVSVPFRDTCAAEFDHPTSAVLGPGELRAVAMEAVRSCHAALFADLFRSGRLNASVADSVYFRLVVRMKGRHGGTNIESDPFDFPLKVCYGCLQTGFPDQYAAFNFPAVPSCDRLAQNTFRGNARCNRPAQDWGPILCCARDASGTSLQCPGVPTAPSGTTPPTGM